MKAAMKTIVSACVAACSMTIAVAVSAADVKLPPEVAKLRPSTLPGYQIASQKCGICHSADYVDYQPPKMTKAQWTGEMTKMQKAYGAPISEDEIKLLGVYLAATYGDASTVTDADRTTDAAASTPVTAAATAVDVQALLTSNGCLACHATDKTIVGPSYRDVAMRYKPDAGALAKVQASIQAGGSGKWGSTPMPPFANLSAEQAKALAEYVLKQ